MNIDAHQHYWQPARGDYGWLQPASGCLYADFMPEQLKPLLTRHQFDRSIIVQAAPTVAETEFLLAIAAKEDTVAGVVGWLDLTARDFIGQWERLLENPRFVGLRPMIQDLPSEWILRERVVEHLRILADAGFPLDLQANPRHLPYLLRLFEQVPHLRAVVDHLAKPNIEDGAMEPWAAQMTAIAAYPNTMCKLSGMVPERQNASWSTASIVPFAAHAIAIFGAERVMFGSDWPVCLLSASYDQVVELHEACLPAAWGEAERANVCGRNAARFYRLAT
ncbi:amidohydrolase family protein [Paenibacillus sp. GCM10027626]|uniref:amidohydrolase family protein n=1 Tax=Paenibacillus sp. GCM10027626 TaxID=3273411 RepID=UPI003639E3B4